MLMCVGSQVMKVGFENQNVKMIMNECTDLLKEIKMGEA